MAEGTCAARDRKLEADVIQGQDRRKDSRGLL